MSHAPPTIAPGIRGVAFDAVGVLIAPAEPVPAVYAEAGRRFGLDLPPQTVAARFPQAFARHLGPAAKTPTRDRDAWLAVVREVFAPAATAAARAGRPLDEVNDDVGSTFVTLWDHYARPAAWRVYEDVPAVLDGLRRRGVACGVASNFDARLHAVLDGHDALKPLAPRVVGTLAGVRKPGRDYYDAAASAFGPPPHALLLADDTPANVAAARACGWHAVLIDRPAAGLAAVADAVGG